MCAGAKGLAGIVSLALVSVAGCSAPREPAIDAGATSALWQSTGLRAEFPSALTVANATAITIDGTYIYWITNEGGLYRAPRAGGGVDRVLLPTPGTQITAHNDVFVGWTEADETAAVAEIDPATGAIKSLRHHPGRLRGLVAGQRGHTVAVAANGGTVVEACLDGACTPPSRIESDLLSLALDLPTKTFYVLAVDGLRVCKLPAGCPADRIATPPDVKLVAALPQLHFTLDARGQAWAAGGSVKLASAAVPDPHKLVVVDGNGKTASAVGTWSNGTELAQAALEPAATTTTLAFACADFDVDATGRPIYCLERSDTIRIIE